MLNYINMRLMIYYFDVLNVVATFCYEHPLHATNQQQCGGRLIGGTRWRNWCVVLSRAGDSSKAKLAGGGLCGGTNGSSGWRNCCVFLSRAGDSSEATPFGGDLGGGTNGSWGWFNCCPSPT
jgi:hypothetical protein